MSRIYVASLLAAALLTAPLPLISQNTAAQTAQPVTTKKAESKKPPSAGQLAARERQKKCGAEWRAAKAAGKIEKGMKWPHFWSLCNKRLKAAGG